MTISMDKVYERMLSTYSAEIEDAIKEKKEYIKISFDSFRIGLKIGGLVNSRITAKEKWENAIADGIIYIIGSKKVDMGAIDVEELLRRTGQLSIYKYKYIFSETDQTAQEGSE